jgi:hypothetical protein
MRVQIYYLSRRIIMVRYQTPDTTLSGSETRRDNALTPQKTIYFSLATVILYIGVYLGPAVYIYIYHTVQFINKN